MNRKKGKVLKGFTLIELLVVIGILAVLLAITLIAVNPAKQFALANNTKRSSNVLAILNAIGQYSAENKGAMPAGSGAGGGQTLLSGCTSTAPCFISNVIAVSPKIDLCSVLTTEFIAELPKDPSTGTGTPTGACSADYNTRYTVYQSAGDNRITVSAPDTQLTPNVPIITKTQ